MAQTPADEKREEAYRAVQASVIAALQTTLETGETLLGFTRGRISGGWKGKLSVGLEAFFAPDVNIGLTDRRLILQHITNTAGKPSQILPHTFPLEKLKQIQFSDIETYGGELAGRLIVREHDDTTMRLRLTGKEFCLDAATLSEVFKSLLQAQQPSRVHPTAPPCPGCGRALAEPARFCPYCGTKLEAEGRTETSSAAEAEPKLEAPLITPEPLAPEPPPSPSPPEMPPPAESVGAALFPEPSLPPSTMGLEEPSYSLDAGAEIPAELAPANREENPAAPLEAKEELSELKEKEIEEFWKDFARISGIAVPEKDQENH